LSESVPASISSVEARKARVAAIFGATTATYDTVIPFFAHWGARLVAHANLTVGERVLDLCCGTGSSLFPAASSVGLAGSVAGIDLAPEMVEAARTAAANLDATNVTVEVGDAGALDFDDASFDAVLCGFGIMFLPSPAEGIKEMARVLRPGGRMVVSVPDADLPAAVKVKDHWRERKGIQPPGGPPGDVAALMAEAGAPGALVIDETHDFPFDDADHYVAWCRTHGARALFDALTGDEQQAFVDELRRAAESERTTEGIVMHARARFWRATKGG
jgi:SAM-dependent methyltransferase